MTAPPIEEAIMLPPDDVLRVWDERTRLQPTVNWREMMHAQHASAFTVAKIARLDLLNQVRTSLDTAMREGKPFEAWKRGLLPELKRAGWWGRVENADLTGTADEVVVNDRRLRTIYRTNMRMSVAGGRWRKFWRERTRFPYLRYQSDHYRKHPRLQHKAWHGLVLSIDDPAWHWLFPPNGWGCNCTVRQVTQARLDRAGWAIGPSPGPNPDAAVSEAFQYNPGIAHLRIASDKARGSIDDAIAVANDVAADATLREIVESRAFDEFASMPEGVFPIAIMPRDVMAAIAAPRQIVLPAGVIRKQLGEHYLRPGHPELDLSDYRALVDLWEKSTHVGKQDETRLIVMFNTDGKLFKVVLRKDPGEAHAIVVSFHRIRASQVTKQLPALQMFKSEPLP